MEVERNNQARVQRSHPKLHFSFSPGFNRVAVSFGNFFQPFQRFAGRTKTVGNGFSKHVDGPVVTRLKPGENENQIASGFMIAIPKLILASASPRRAEILRSVGWPFEILPVHIDESRGEEEIAASYVERVALAKAQAALQRDSTASILGADTVVVIDNQILGKPVDEDDARRMLRLLSGRWHQVLTGVALIYGATSQSRVAHELTEVRFAEMNEDEINWYVATGEPLDKAGAYAIQGHGALFIEGLRGDYFNVVGLPVRLLYKLFRADSLNTSMRHI